MIEFIAIYWLFYVTTHQCNDSAYWFRLNFRRQPITQAIEWKLRSQNITCCWYNCLKTTLTIYCRCTLQISVSGKNYHLQQVIIICDHFHFWYILGDVFQQIYPTETPKSRNSFFFFLNFKHKFNRIESQQVGIVKLCHWK